MERNIITTARSSSTLEIDKLCKIRLKADKCNMSDREKSIILENILVRLEYPTIYVYALYTDAETTFVPLTLDTNKLMVVLNDFIVNESFEITDSDVLNIKGKTFSTLDKFLQRRMLETYIRIVRFDDKVTYKELEYLKERLGYTR